MSNPTADQYRQNAEDCRWNADRAPADEKDRWLKVAADWEKMAEELDQRSPDRQGGEKRKPDALLVKRATAAFCDDCIAKQIGIGPSQVNRITLTLGLTTDFQQMTGRCSVCDREKLVTSRRSIGGQGDKADLPGWPPPHCRLQETEVGDRR